MAAHNETPLPTTAETGCARPGDNTAAYNRRKPTATPLRAPGETHRNTAAHNRRNRLRAPRR